ncbi:MAG: tRNA lysidine(34) synthetase TilS [Rhizobiales bacterium]|nr:tRNA lysidine(34) synthetase TilS [Hyphomicrobiales bacterium]
MPVAEEIAAPIGADEACVLFDWLAGRDRIAIAVSGGRDSMALLRMMQRWADRSEARMQIVALTVDHDLRAGSQDEARQVADWCAALGVEHHCLKWAGLKPQAGIQERAREARYRLMSDWCHDHGFGALALAHHLEDQAETLLMRLARSSGVDGLAAMERSSVRDGIELLRPLLNVPRARIEATLEAFNQDWIDDPSNADLAFERVRICSNAEALSDLGLDAPAIAGSAAKLVRAAKALSKIAADRFIALTNVDATGFATIDGGALRREPQEIAMRIISSAIKLVGGRERFSDGALARMTEGICDDTFRAATLGGCRVSQEDGKILVVRESRSLPHTVISPGAVVNWDNRFAISLGNCESTVELRALGKRGFAAAKRLNPSLQTIPPIAGWVLPGGFRSGGLALAPDFGASGEDSMLTVRFLRAGTQPEH